MSISTPSWNDEAKARPEPNRSAAQATINPAGAVSKACDCSANSARSSATSVSPVTMLILETLSVPCPGHRQTPTSSFAGRSRPVAVSPLDGPTGIGPLPFLRAPAHWSGPPRPRALRMAQPLRRTPRPIPRSRLPTIHDYSDHILNQSDVRTATPAAAGDRPQRPCRGPVSPTAPCREPATPPLSEPQRDFPVVLDVTGWRCLVVGGGRVAARRVRGLLSAGARVTVVAPRPGRGPGGPGRGDRGERSRGRCRLVLERRPYRPGEAAGYQLVVTATGRTEVDGAVVGDAVARRDPGDQRRPRHPGHDASPRRPPVGAGDPRRLDRRHQPGPGPVAAHRLAACLPAGAGHHRRARSDEARTDQQEAGRPTDATDWDVTPRRACRTPGPGRPGRRGAGDPPAGRRTAAAGDPAGPG